MVAVRNDDKGLAVCLQHHGFERFDIGTAHGKEQDGVFFVCEHAFGGPGGDPQAQTLEDGL